uniref:Taste receptor type 2 n=1 Tax=Urocitellus parryii TaxID=9999 RepID=A0A8D2KD40_UROPR
MMDGCEQMKLCFHVKSVLGVLGNEFIGLVNCMDCVKNKKFSINGFILTGLAISRVSIIWYISFDGVIKSFSPDMHTSSDLTEYFSYLFLCHLNIWFSTNLSIFYFLKTANFSHYIFLWLKRRINRVFAFLIGCLLVSWLLTFLQVVKVISGDKMNHRNTSYHSLLYSIPNYLCPIDRFPVETQKSYATEQKFADLNTEAHVKAMGVLISFIILLILHVIGILIEAVCGSKPENKLLFTFGFTTTAIYPWGHSFILILGNNKLKQTCWRVLQQLKCCEKGKNLRASDRLAQKRMFQENNPLRKSSKTFFLLLHHILLLFYNCVMELHSIFHDMFYYVSENISL